MSYIDRIKLVGDLGDKNFILPNGKQTKKIYNASEFDFDAGSYPILNDKNEVVEYMDIMGRFTIENTELAKCLCRYALSSKNIPIKYYGYDYVYYSGLVNFPSKFLADEEVKKFIKEQEDDRYKKMCSRRCFPSLIERLKYKCYVGRVWKQKLNKLAKCGEQTNVLANEIEQEELSI